MFSKYIITKEYINKIDNSITQQLKILFTQ